MSMREQDIERGPEAFQPMTGPMPMLAARQDPVPRDRTMSPSQMSRTLSQHASGMMFESPILAAFRYHIGIYNDPSLSATATQAMGQNRSSGIPRSMGGVLNNIAHGFTGGNDQISQAIFSRPAANVGIYQRVVAAETKYHKEYKLFSLLINGALGLQIIFAAALTALGASSGSHYAVTAFGALNTVLAGFLTFLKGSGLPNRLKYYENEWSKVREYIEQRERDLASDVHRGTVGWEELAEEIALIEHKYDVVRRDIESNTPDRYVTLNNTIQSMKGNNNTNGGETGNHRPVGLQRGLSKLSQTMEKADDGARQAGNNIQGRILSGISEIQHRVGKGISDLEKQATVHVREISDDAHSTGKLAETRINSALQSVEGGIQHAQQTAELRTNDAQARLNQTQRSVEDSMRQAQTTAQSSFNNAQNAAQTSFNEAQQSVQNGMQESQYAAESRLRDAQNQLQHRFSAAEQQIAESQHHAETKAKEMEEKIARVAEAAAEKVLALTRHRHT